MPIGLKGLDSFHTALKGYSFIFKNLQKSHRLNYVVENLFCMLRNGSVIMVSRFETEYR